MGPWSTCSRCYPRGALDIAQNPNKAIVTCNFKGCNELLDQGDPPSDCFCPQRGIEVTEIADTLIPTVSSIQFDFGTGKVQISCSETVSNSLVNISKIRVYNDTSAPPILLDGAQILGDSTPTVTLKMVEADRITLLQAAGTAGGDGIPLIVNIDEGAFFDLGRNAQPLTVLSGNAVEEIADKLGPTLLSADLYFSDNKLVIHGDETIDASTLDLLNISRFFLGDDASRNDIALHGATGIPSKALTIEIILTPTQIGKAVKLSTVYDGTPLVLNVLAMQLKI